MKLEKLKIPLSARDLIKILLVVGFTQWEKEKSFSSGTEDYLFQTSHQKFFLSSAPKIEEKEALVA